jgi:hypothetical protein
MEMIKDMTCEEIRRMIADLGDCTNELSAGHDPEDKETWIVILGENLASELPDSNTEGK